MLPEDGWFLSMDYVGPHRNQYTTEAWEHAWQVNDQLPTQVRQSMLYPHLPTMLHDDPTEAIHSEFIVETLQRYFHIERFVPLGGALGYSLLTFNEGLFGFTDKREQTAWVEHVLRVDEAFLDEHPDSTLFVYLVARPNKEALESPLRWRRWEQEEPIARIVPCRTVGSTTDAQRSKIRTPVFWPRPLESTRLRQEVVDLQVSSMRCEHDPTRLPADRLRASSPFRALRVIRLPVVSTRGYGVRPPADIRLSRSSLIPLPRPVTRTV